MATRLPDWIPIPILAVVLMLVLWAMLSLGCTTPTINEINMTQLKGLIGSMEQAGLAGYAEIELGRPGIIIEQKYGLDLGIHLRVRVMARPYRDAMSFERAPPVEPE